jgi:hypothetical protein
MDAGTLFNEISKVCPVGVVYVKVPDERDTWTYEALPNATDPQKAAADNVIATIPITVPGLVSQWEFIARWTNAEYKALQQLRMNDNGHTAKSWDIVMSIPMVDMSKKKVQSLKTDLVADGVLTQARANEIFV